MNWLRSILITITILVIGFLLFWAVTAPAGAISTKVGLCHEAGPFWNYLEVDDDAVSGHLGHGDYLYAGSGNISDFFKTLWCYGHVPQPSPSPSPTVVSSPSPTGVSSPSPSPSVEPSPTVNPCDGQCESPTPEPSREPEPTPQGLIESAPSGPNICKGLDFVQRPANFHVVRSGSSAELKWTPTQGAEASIRYYENENQANAHGYKTNNDGYEKVNFLGSLNWTFGLAQWDGCATSDWVYVVDDNLPRLFRYNYSW